MHKRPHTHHSRINHSTRKPVAINSLNRPLCAEHNEQQSSKLHRTPSLALLAHDRLVLPRRRARYRDPGYTHARSPRACSALGGGTKRRERRAASRPNALTPHRVIGRGAAVGSKMTLWTLIQVRVAGAWAWGTRTDTAQRSVRAPPPTHCRRRRSHRVLPLSPLLH